MLTAGLPDQEDHLCNVEQDTNPWHSQHEHSEDGLLCGPRHEAVHRVRTGVRVTLHQPDHLVTGVDHIEDVHKGDLKDNTEQQADDVRPPQSPRDFHLLGLYLFQVFGVGPPWQFVDPFVDMAPVGHMHGDQQGGSGDQDELERPEADVGDGEKVVIADTVATRLLGVAGEAGLLVPPHALRGNHQNQDAENEQDREPDATDAGGVSVHTTDDSIKGCPVHFWFRVWVAEKNKYITINTSNWNNQHFWPRQV